MELYRSGEFEKLENPVSKIPVILHTHSIVDSYSVFLRFSFIRFDDQTKFVV